MTRYIGAALILASSGAMGIGMVRALRYRVRCLSAVCQALLILKSEICGRLTPLRDAFEKLSEEGPALTSPLFAAALEGMSRLDSRSAADIWREAVFGDNGLDLTAREREDLAAAGAVLGRCDLELQSGTLGEAAEKFREYLSRAETKADRDGRANAMLSITAGIFAVLILL